MSLSLKIKSTNGINIETSADPDLTVYDLKSICYEQLHTIPEKQTLLFKGKVCDDDQTLEALNITNNSTLYVLLKNDNNENQQLEEKKQPEQPNSNNPNNAMNMMGNPAFLQQMMNNPLVKQMFNNPNVMQRMFESSPALKKMMEKNPEMKHALKDPDLMKQLMRAATDPNYRNEMRKNNDATLKNIESIPGGFSALSRMYKQMQDPMESAMDDMYEQRHGKLKTKITEVDTSNGPVTEPMGNPWSKKYQQEQAQLKQQSMWKQMANNQQQNNNMSNNNMFNMFNMMNSMNAFNNNKNMQNMVNESPSQMYVIQLRELRAMGFNDEQKNINALRATGGNVDAAIQYLIDNENNQ